MGDVRRIKNGTAHDLTADIYLHHAELMRAYYARLRDLDFSADEAFVLVMEATKMSLHRMLWPNGEKY